jgi:hypothetical protein
VTDSPLPAENGRRTVASDSPPNGRSKWGLRLLLTAAALVVIAAAVAIVLLTLGWEAPVN